jgi:hypothetical protein
VWSRDSPVGITTSLRARDDRGVRVRFSQGKGFFSSSNIQTGFGSTQPSMKWVPRADILEVKQQGRTADHSPPSGAEVKNGGVIHLLPHTFSRHGS